jgi:hypothetical protein
MTTTRIVGDQKRKGGDGDDRYRDASKKLRQQIRDEAPFRVADEWAREVCAQAEQYNWPKQPRSEQTLAIGKKAAELADLLESKSGVTADSEWLRRLAARHDYGKWCQCGPVKMKFTSENQNKMPPKAAVLALVLCHGFKQIPAFVKANKKFILRLREEIRGGDCYESAALFAKAALGQETNAETIKKWGQRTRGRLRYWGFSK